MHRTQWLTFLFVICPLVSAQAIEYNIVISPDQEVPAPNLGGSTPTGSATVDVNTLTGEVTVTGSYDGLTSNAAAAHIHGLAPPSVTAGVLLGLSVDGGTTGNLTGGGTLDTTSLNGLLAGQTYVNIHTANNGPGEIRGQIIDDDILVYDVMLTTAQEIPAPNVGAANPEGVARLVVDTSNGLVEISGSYTGMTSAVAAAHLHGLADPGVNAGVLIPLTVSGGTAGTFSGSGTLDGDGLAGLLQGMTYLNVHTANNGPGEIRGQVVPEPGSFALILLGAMAMLKYRRR